MKRWQVSCYKVFIIIWTCLLLSLDNSVRAQPAEAVTDSLKAAHISSEKLRVKSLWAARPEEIRAIVTPLGEPDVFKFIQTLPGVSTGMEGSSAFFVRGGNMGNNLMTLDGISIYGATHLLGLASVVPQDIIDSSDFRLGGFESTEANLLASHVLLRTADHFSAKPSFAASISNMMGTTTVKMPLIKEKLSFVASARFSPAQWEYNVLRKHFIPNETGLPETIGATVYDFYGRLAWQPHRDHRIRFSWFRSHDNYDFRQFDRLAEDHIGWGNNILLLDYSGTIVRGWQVKASASINHFRTEQEQERRIFESEEPTFLRIQSTIQEKRATVSLSYNPKASLSLSAGIDWRAALFRPSALIIRRKGEASEGVDIPTTLASFHADVGYTSDASVFLRGSFRINRFWDQEGYGVTVPEFHLLADWSISPMIGIEATIDRLAQFYHTLEGVPTGISTDLIIPSSRYAKPERAWQYYLGFFSKPDNHLHISLGAFYKQMQNLVFFQEADKFFSVAANSWKEGTQIGSGTSAGIEVYGKKTGKRVTAQFAYTLSKTNRIFPEINEGKAFPFKFDRRHILNTSGECFLVIRERSTQKIGAFFTLASGHFESLQAGTYPAYVALNDLAPVIMPVEELGFFTHPNNYHHAPYIRCDLSYTFHWQATKLAHDLTVGVYNVLNRHNAYSLTWDAKTGRWMKMSIMPVLPSISYRLSF